MTTTEANRQTILEFFRRSQDGEDVMSLLSEDLTWWVPGNWALSGTYSKTELANIFARVFGMLDGRPQFTIHNITAEEDRVAVDASSNGRFKDGGPFGNTYHFLFVLRDDLIVQGKEYMDTDYMVQLIATRPDILG